MAFFVNDQPEKNNFDNPQIEVTITTPGGSRIELVSRNVGGSIIKVNVKKSLRDQAGTFNFILTDSNKIEGVEYKILNKKKDLESRTITYREYLVHKSFVKIKINNVVQMLGIIDNVNRTTQPGNMTQIVVTGRDMGAMLLDFKRYWTEFMNTPLNNLSLTGKQLQVLNFDERVQVLFEQVYADWMDRIITDPSTEAQDQTKSWHIFDSKGNLRGISDILRIRSRLSYDDTSSAFAVDGGLYTNEARRYFGSFNNDGDFFTIFEQFVSRPLNEMWVTSGGRVITLGKKFEETISGSTVTINTASQQLGLGAGEEALGPLVDRVKLDEDTAYLVLRPAPYNSRNDKGDDRLVNTVGTGGFDEVIETGEELVPNNLLDLEDLEAIRVTDDSILQKNLAYGQKSNLYSTYAVQPYGLNGAAFFQTVVPPKWDERILRNHGYNPLIIEIDALSINNDNAGGTFVSSLQTFQNMLYNWFRHNDKHLTGTFVVEGEENVREGMALYYQRNTQGRIENEDDERVYYINGFQQDWTFGDGFTSTIEVEHGIKVYKPDIKDPAPTVSEDTLIAQINKKSGIGV